VLWFLAMAAPPSRRRTALMNDTEVGRAIMVMCGGTTPADTLAIIQCNGLPEPLDGEVGQQRAEALLRRMVPVPASPPGPPAQSDPYHVLPLAELRFRLTSKQPDPHRVLSVAEHALAAEDMRDLTLLSDDARRQHVHWVHTRTNNPQDRQPESFSRRGFFQFMVGLYFEVYPERANRQPS
jgi:hypothetical protein